MSPVNGRKERRDRNAPGARRPDALAAESGATTSAAVIFDCHDEAYHCWRDAGVRGATLVHVDAHHDLEPGPSSGLVHVGNYVRVAIAEGLVARLLWVVPQVMWDDAATRAIAERDLARLRCGVDASVAPLSAVPSSAESVLLDVDLDYLFTIAFDRDPAVAVCPDPWCSVEALAADLLSRWPSRQLTTIATSLTGGFTPIRWKHLARELAARLESKPPAPGWDDAARAFQHAETLYARGAVSEARAAFIRAVAADPEYRHPYRTAGHLYRAAGRAEPATRAFEAALDLDPEDGWARLGLSMLALDQGRAADALSWLGRIDAADRRIDAWRTLCRARAAVGDVDAAIAAGSRALSLALAGEVPLSVWTCNRDQRLVDPDHLEDHARLASLYRLAGDTAAALAHQRIAGAAGKPHEERS